MTWTKELFKDFIGSKRKELSKKYGTNNISAYDSEVESKLIIEEEDHLYTWIYEKLLIADPLKYICYVLSGEPIQ